ncbi:hypothetical protein ARSEF4850_009222 [Beauveria asiatica]
MSAAAGPPPPPPPGGRGGAGPLGHRRVRRSVGGILISGDSDDEEFGEANEVDFPCLTCLNASIRSMEFQCVPTSGGACQACHGKKRTCVYEHTLFANHPRLRRAAAEMVSLIDQGKAIGTPAVGKKREKGYKFPIASADFARAVRRFNGALDAARANPGAALDAFAPQPPPGPPGPTPPGSQVVLAPPPSRGRGAQNDMGLLVGALTASLQAGFQTLAAEQRSFQENVMAALAPPQTPRRRAIEYDDEEWQRSHSRRGSRDQESSRRRRDYRRRSRSPRSPSHRRSSRRRSRSLSVEELPPSGQNSSQNHRDSPPPYDHRGSGRDRR